MKLLLADDEKELSQAICAILEHKGYEVDPVYDGREALEKARIQYYDGYIFDIMMPEMDGVEVLTALRQQGNTTPALLLTAKAEVEDRVKGLNAGADDYLTKPFAMKELIARIGAMTRRKEMMADDRLVCGNVALMRRTMELTNGDSSIRLSQHEYGLAELFFQNPGKNITTPQIRERVWQGDAAEEGTVRVYTAYLQNKLGALRADVRLVDGGKAVYRLEVPS